MHRFICTFFLLPLAFILASATLSFSDPVFTIQNKKDACNGLSNGSFDILVTSGTGTLTAFVFSTGAPIGPIPLTLNVPSNVSGLTGTVAGRSYLVVVSDDIGSTNSNPLDPNTKIFLKSNISASIISSTNSTSCLTPNGAIDIDVTGGTSAYTYSWTATNGFTAITQDISGLSAGDYTVIVSDGGTHCTQTLGPITITQPSAPTNSVLSLTGSNPICTGQSSTVRVIITGGTAPYSLTITGLGVVNNYASGSNITVTPASTTNYILSSVVDASGCSSVGVSGSVTITVNSVPIAPPVTFTPSSYCVGSVITAPKITTPTGGSTYTWYSDAGLTSVLTTGTTPTNVQLGFSSIAANTTTVYVTETNSSNCKGPATTVTLTVNALPVVNTPSASLCIGSTMTASPSAGGTWVSSAPGVATITNAGLITGVSAGVVTFTFTNTATGCSKTTASVTVNALPVVSTPSASLCIGATMTAIPSAGGTWVSSAPGVATITNAGLITGVSAGVVTFTFTNTATGCSKTTTSVTVNALPVVSTPSASLCIGSTMTASPSAGGTWVSSAPGVAIITNAGLITGVSAGVVTFTFTNTATGCSKTTTSVTVNALPVVSTPSASLCIGATMTAIPSAGGTWVSSAPGVATITNAGLITGVSAGVVTFTFTNTATGCSKTTASVTVNALPVVSTPSASLCIGATMTAIPSAGGTWVSSAPGVATITNAGLITGVSAGVVTFTFTNTATGCSKTTTSVTVNALPVVSTPSASLCIGATMTASPSAGGTWVSSAPGVATITNAGLITGVSSGAVTFTFTDTATGCSNSTSSVTVNTLPVVTTPSATLCIGATMTASPSAGGTWVSSAPGVATITNAGLITGVSAGAVTFTFTNTATGCSKTTASVTVNALPVVSTPSASLCIGATMTASPSAGGTWVSSAPGVATITNAGLITGVSAGVVTFTFTNTATGCSKTTTSVTVNALPVVSTPSASLCIGATMTASPSAGGTWVSSAPGVATITNAGLITGVSSGAVTFTFTDTATGCSNSTSSVTVNTLPVVTTPSATLCIGATMTASPSAGGTWVSSAPGVATITNAGLITGVSAGVVTFTFTDTATGCSKTTTSVTVNALPVVSTPSASLCIGSTMTASPSAGGTWVSSTPGVATITNAGLITGVSAGAVTFTFTAASGCSSTTASVTIKALPLVSTPSASLCIGATMTASPSAGGTWISSAPGVATIGNTGLITGISAGAVTFTFTDTATGCSNTTSSVTVNALPVVSTPSASLCLGSTMTASPSAGGTWVSSAPGVATITNAGLITGISAGVVTFTFTNTATGCSNTTSSVTVSALLVVSTPSASLCIGANMTASPSAGGTWISSAPGVATIDNTGLITGISAGAVTFTFTDTATGCSNTTSSVTVNALPVVSTPSASLCIGANMTASPNAGGTWVSSAPGVATIDNTGLITGISAGAVTFTFTDTATGCSNTTSSVTVNALPVVSTPSASLCIGANMTASPSAGGTWISSAPGVATIDNAGLITGIAAGAVTFTFTEITTGCSNTTSSVTINAPLVVSTPLASLCIGATMTASPSAGGTWVSSAPGVATITNAGLITGISEGSATFTFTNTATGCSNTTSSVTINARPTASISGSTTICLGSTATLQISLTGVGPWIIIYSDGTTIIPRISATNSIAISVNPTVTKTYTLVTVIDSNCLGTIIGSPAVVTVDNLPQSGLSISSTINPVCTGGSSSIVVANSEAGVSYQLRNSADNSNVGSSLVGTGASLDLPTGVLNSTTIFNVLASNGTCSVQLTSMATITVLGNIDSSLTVSVQDSPICQGSSTNVFVDNSVIGVTYQLRDDSDDSLIGSAVSGTGGTISLPTGVLLSSKVFNVLAANGTCSIELTNTANVTVDINPDPSLSVAAALNPLCIGGSTNVTVSASELGVAYQLRDDSDNSLIGSALAGTGGQIDLPTGVLNSTITFNILATGGVCTPVQLNNKVTITVSGSIDLTLATTVQTSPICAGGNTNIQIANSEAGVDYQLINDSNNLLIPGVVTGTGGLINLATGNLNITTTFRVLATNASCSAELISTSTVNVTALPSVTLTVTAVNSTVCEFSSTFVQVANSEPGVTYQLRNDADNSIISGAVIGNGNTIDLPTGILTATTTFNVLATNGNCPLELSNTITITVDNAPIETLAVVAQDPAVCNGKSTMIQVLNTEPGIIYQLRDDADNSMVSGATFGNGGTINLPTGIITASRTFNVLASNSQCSIKLLNTASVTLLAINDPLCSNCSSVVVSTINPVKVTCGATIPDGSITFQIEPPVPIIDIIGVKIEISGPTPKTQTNDFVFTGLAAGSYTYIVTYGDENNPACIKSGSFVIESKGVPDPIIFDVFVNEFNCRNYKGSISLQNIEGEPNTAYDFTVLNNGTPFMQGVISASSQSFTVPGLLLGDYQIQLKQNQEPANGCVGIVSSPLIDFSIVQPPGGCGLFIPNIFSPNNDGVNDSFLIRELPANSSVTITNRWGKEVYSSSNYQNNWTAENIADGIYYYRIVADGEPINGWVEILR